MINLDYYCMEHGQKLADICDEIDLRKSLGILKEDGVYAMFLWLEYTCRDNMRTNSFLNFLLNFLNEDSIKPLFLNDDKYFRKPFDQFCKDLRDVAKDIDKVFLMKRLLERTLTYALYHRKIASKDGVS